MNPEAGKRLRSERERLGLSQTAFAEKCGVGKRMQIYFEQGKNAPGGAYLAAAAKIGVDVGYVIEGTPDRFAATLDRLKRATDSAVKVSHVRDEAVMLRDAAFEAGSAQQYDEAALLDSYRRCDPDGKAEVKSLAAKLATSGKVKKSSTKRMGEGK
jgi:transcriptional regulator with XRE-family HTH domain